MLVASAALVVAAIAGGAAALTGAALLWGIGGSSSAAPAEPASASTNDPGITTARFRGAGQPLTIGQIYQRARAGVVRVSTESVVRQSDPFGLFPTMAQEQRGLGSGFVIDKSGFIVTNYHVVQGAQRIRVSFSNNESMAAKLVGSDPSTDVAVLKVSAESRALRPLELGDSDGVHVGDAVVAIGNPLGYERTVTSGIVSATGRAIQAPNQSLIDQVIQTDAAINQGNSGGPLLSSDGRVIGVNTQIATENGGNVGLGFAIPINTVKDVASQIIDKGRVEHAQLGLSAQAVDPGIAKLFHLPVSSGLLVADVDPGSGAAKAGIRAGTQHVTVDGETYVMGGDLVVAADGRPMRTVEALREVVSAKDPGDAIRLDFYRGTTKHTVHVKLGRQPSSPRG
jgi:S1-C subfamily serine protease